LLDPRELGAFAREISAATLFVSNLYFWFNAHPLGYFDGAVSSQPLLHTWSLAVEEQFYLLFPLTLVLFYRWSKGRLGQWVVAASIVSFVLNLWTTSHLPIFAFYWLPPRAWELLIGSLLGLKALPPLSNRLRRECVGLFGAALITAAIILPLKHLPFPGYVALLPCVGTFLVIYAGEGGASVVRTAFSLSPLVFVGTISYSLYLWHWPIIVFFAHQPFHPMRTTELVIAFVMAFLSFEYIERPFRGSASAFSRNQVFILGGVASVGTLAFGCAALISNGLPQRYASVDRSAVMANLLRMDDYNYSCGNWKTDTRSLADIHFCNLGNDLPGKIMFWGDSHVEQLYPAVQQIYSAGELRGRGVIFAVANSCLPDTQLNRSQDGYHCDAFARLAMLRAAQSDIDTVYIGFSTWWGHYDYDYCAVIGGKCTMPLTQEALRKAFFGDLAEEVSTLRSQGKKVIVALPFPIYDRDIPELEISNAMFGRIGFTKAAKNISVSVLREQTQTTAAKAGAEIFDPLRSLCSPQGCITAVDGVSIYKDSNHLAKSAVGTILIDNLRDTLNAR
jgi:peptidoglycan/LPS O-acetylase OafA/YrhL